MTTLLLPTWPRRRRVSAATLLRADAEVVPFRGREAELARLAEWCDSAEEFDLLVLVGSGGQGKTRLGRQLVHLRAEADWTAGFLAADPPGQPLDLTAITDTATPTLLVVDHAETRTDQITRLLHAVGDSAGFGPVRLLLLARSAGQWWDRLRQRHRGMLDGTSVIELPTLDGSLVGRQDAFDSAVDSFARALSEVDPDTDWQAIATSVTAPGDIDEEQYGAPLTLQMTALITLLDNASTQTTVSQRVPLLALDAADGAYQQLVEAGQGEYTQKLAEVRLRRAEVLVARGSRTVGLTASQDALRLYRQLARKDPAFRSALANALRVHAAALTADGQRQEALEAAEESVRIYRTLSQVGADAHRHDLERALNTLSDARRDAGLSEEPGAPQLRISILPGQLPGQQRVRVSWREVGTLPREAEAVFADPSDRGDSERIRWYLEDYAEFPADPAPLIAREAETRLAELGTTLFQRVFEASRDTLRIWEAALASLPQARVEVDTDPGEGPGPAWELLRDPGRDAAVALGAGAFVRAPVREGRHPDLPEPAGDRLRVLLVIARPGGREDVPFRSVAGRLVRGGAEQMAGLDLDMLRPATFARLSQVLHAAHDAGRPYHVVHFDGHGTWLDLAGFNLGPDDAGAGGRGALPADGLMVSPLIYGMSVAGPMRPGQHGYLLFEDPDSPENQQLADGPTLGRLLVDAGVPVLVLNASRSAYSEALTQPGGEPDEMSEAPPDRPQTSLAEADSALTGDVHARIRAYGSLAAEVADAGVPGVVAMRYNVYVVTAAQFVADLYAHLLAGRSLGQAAAAARKALAADPVRQIGTVPVSLQDWAVPVVYESAPLVLLRPPDRTAPLIRLTPAETATDRYGVEREVPQPPDAGFFGRDETLLALDRAFDSQPVVLLHAFAGSGKTTTAAEFARWYPATGGLDLPERPEWPGAVLWSSFEHHLTADRVIGTAGDYFAPLLEANGIQWAAVTDLAERRDIALQVLAQIPVLWVWDNVEPVTGFPAGTQSDWTQAEQDDLAGLLQDLARTQCKVLVTSRRDERHWLDDLPARVRLPPMPVRESLQLVAALATQHGGSVAGADWRPLVRYAAGNPLTITVLVGQALRDNLATTEQIERFVARLEAGETGLEASQDAELGRSRSLATSLSYGFAEAFTDQERHQLALLHLFRDTVDADALSAMGDRVVVGEDAVPELAGLDRQVGTTLLDRAASIGLLASLGSGHYQIHPALPWYFTSLYTSVYGQSGSPAAMRATRAYATAIGTLGDYYHGQAQEGRAAQVVPVLRTEEANLRHAMNLARALGLWDATAGCLQGLRILYERTGRDGEWARLVAEITPDFTDQATGGPLPDRGNLWSIITSYRVRLAWQARDWPTATTLQNARVAWNRDRAAAALAAPSASLTQRQGNQIRNLAASLADLGQILLAQDNPGCLPYYQEALALSERIGDRAAEALVASNLGNTYLTVPGLRDLDQAEQWYRHSLSLSDDSDRFGRAMSLGSLGGVALQRFDDALASGEANPVLQKHLNTALHNYQQVLDLSPADDHGTRGITEHQLGIIYNRVGDTSQALRHYQQALKHEEARGNIYGAGQTRYNIALLLDDAGRIGDAFLYARAARDNFQQAGPGAASAVVEAEQVIARLEQRSS